MTHKDAEDLAAEIAYMQDDPSFHPRHNKKGKNVMTEIEEYLNADVPKEVWIHRNEALHKHIIKLETDLIKEREDHLKLKQKIKDLLNEYRNKGQI